MTDTQSELRALPCPECGERGEKNGRVGADCTNDDCRVGYYNVF